MWITGLNGLLGITMPNSRFILSTIDVDKIIFPTLFSTNNVENFLLFFDVSMLHYDYEHQYGQWGGKQ